MNAKNKEKTPVKKGLNMGRECAYIAVFVALAVAAQLCFSALPGVEVVTVLFVAYAFAFGGKRGMVAATVFSLLRQLLFGFYPVVFILYLFYYNLLALLFGWLGKRVQPLSSLWWLTILACVCTVCFTLADNLLTPLWYGYSGRALKAYFIASLSVLLSQTVCTAVTVGVLFLPLERVFRFARRSL